MFYIKLAELKIKIVNQYDFIEKQCADYIIEPCECDIEAVSSDEEIKIERELSESEFSNGYLESLSIYRIICSQLPFYNAFLLHAAIIEVDDNAYAFLAQSGTGKSTHIRLWRKAYGERVKIINGDKPIIRFFDGEPYAFGTPWAGKERWQRNASARLDSICFIERGEKNIITKLEAANAVGRLFYQVYLPKQTDNTALTLELCDKVLSTVKLYVLKCNMDLEAAHVAYNGMIGK